MNRTEIGAKIKQHRTEKGISKYSVVKSTKLTFAQLSQIESGSKNYTIDTLKIYLDAIELKMSLK
jgi:transcriptional regulator with XRE-family HTH domain